MAILLGHLYKPPPQLTPEADSVKPVFTTLYDVCLRCLQKNPSDRYANLDELRKDLLLDIEDKEEYLDRTMKSRQEQFKQFYKGEIDDVVGIMEGELAQRVAPLRILESADLPVEEALTPFLNILQYEVNEFRVELLDKEPGNQIALILNGEKEENLSHLIKTKETPSWLNIPVIICGSDDDFDYISKSIELGAFDYISQPFNPTDVQRKLKRLKVEE